MGNNFNPFVGDFDDVSDIEGFFREEGALDGATVLYACYDRGGYDGRAIVIFERDGQLYEVFGSHCSCHGLEGQWEPGEVTRESLRMYHREDREWQAFIASLE